jgi:nucleotide-binding universal stress UspA family protein
MKILLAIDESVFSEAAIQAVIGQFRPDKVEVRVFHAVEWRAALPMSFEFGEGPTCVDDVHAVRDKSLRDGDTLVGRVAQQLQAAGFRTNTTMVEGDPRHAILDCATDWQPDLIVMGAHGRKGLERFLIGSVSEAIMRHAACSVEIVRVPAAAANPR